LTISIPYGAIKRLLPTSTNPAAILFQFLMVRLKEEVQMSEKFLLPQFQFLMVRLKAVTLS